MEKLKLREIPEVYRSLLERYTEEDLTDDQRVELETTLNELEYDFADKCEYLGTIVVEEDLHSEAIASEIERLEKYKNRLTRNSERIKDYIKYSMELSGLTNVNTSLFKFTFRKSESVLITDPSLLAGEYVRTIPSKVEPDKTKIKQAIKEAIKNGELFEGACLETKNHLQIK